ncbi:MAG: T9SS type A sorting domain-containing protein [Flavobacteriaceae bacterium]
MKKITLLFLLIGSQLLQSQVTANQPDPLMVCDDDNDGFALFDLTMADAQIIGGQTDVTVTYHLTQADADNGVLPASSPYGNIVQYQQTLYVRVESIINGDFNTTQLSLMVIPLPATTPPAPIVIIDQNGDGIEIFDLTIRENDITDPTLNFDIYYFETFIDAEDNINPIANPSAYQNLTAPTQTIYIRVEDPSTGCFSIESLLLVLDTIPNVPTEIPDPFVMSDPDSDGFAIFDLTTMIPAITGGQTGWEVTFYETEVDAQNKTNLIDTPEVYENNTNPQTMYARTETVYGSFALTEFDIFADENLSSPSFGLGQIAIYPNPTQDFIHINANGINTDFSIEIINMNGQRILTTNYSKETSETATLNISNLTTGMYFLKIISGNNQLTKKLIKK